MSIEILQAQGIVGETFETAGQARAALVGYMGGKVGRLSELYTSTDRILQRADEEAEIAANPIQAYSHWIVNVAVAVNVGIPVITPTTEQLIGMGRLTIEDVKAQKVDEIQASFDAVLAAGYYDQTLNKTFAMGSDDMLKFNNLVTLVGLASELGQAPETIITADINGAIVELTVPELKLMLIYYGGYYLSLWTELIAKKNAVGAATTLAEIEAVTLFV